MTDATINSSRVRDAAASVGLLAQLGMMLRAFWRSPMRLKFAPLALGLVAVILATAYGQIKLNQWNQPFYDALARRDLPDFLEQLLRFGVIAGGLLALNVLQMWLNLSVKVKLRQGLMHDLIAAWMVPGRAFRLANAGSIGANPDQRLHEDARHLTELTADLGIGLLQASILLFTFVSVLWSLSSGFVFHIGKTIVDIPGYMVWAAILYAGSASLLSYAVGRPLIGLNAERYAREADLRYSLMRVSEHIDVITLAGGEQDEERRLEDDVQPVLQAMWRLVWGQTRLLWITAGYGWMMLVAPILVAAPVYFSGSISFGGLMVIVGAFNQVHSSLRWFVDNFSTIADWRATLVRVAAFRRALADAGDDRNGSERLVVEVEENGTSIRMEALSISFAQNSTRLCEQNVVVAAGEKVAIVGRRGSGKTLLFRALAGLWPWGAGRIVRPKGQALFCLPRTPYLPPGSLRENLAYPKPTQAYGTMAYVAALERVGLGHLEASLDISKRWERELGEEEQQSVAFARLLLHRPAWAVMDEVLDSVADETHERFADILRTDLKDTGVIHIGRTAKHDHIFAKVCHLSLLPARPATASRKLVHASNAGAGFSG